MTKKEIQAFTESVNANRLELTLRFMQLDLCTEAHNEQEKKFDETYNRVLSEHEFYENNADYEPRREGDPKKGERITDQNWLFVLSREDFQRVLDLAAPIQRAEGLINENGEYVENWLVRMLDAKRELNEFFIKKIIPESLRQIFWDNRQRVVVMEKMRDIARKMVEA